MLFSEKGARVAFWTKDELEQNFPFMNFDGIVAGTYGKLCFFICGLKPNFLGLENEGCIDTWQLLAALREKNITLGVTYLKGEVEGFQYRRATTDYTFADIHGTVDTEEADSEIHSRKQLTGVIVRPEMHCASARPIQAYRIVNAAGPWAGDIAEMAGIGWLNYYFITRVRRTDDFSEVQSRENNISLILRIDSASKFG